jgi:hypothetical protein
LVQNTGQVKSVNLTKRLARLEKTGALTRENRLVLRFEGTGSEHFLQPTQEDIDSGAEIFTLHFVEAKDGRPA